MTRNAKALMTRNAAANSTRVATLGGFDRTPRVRYSAEQRESMKALLAKMDRVYGKKR